MIAYFVSLAFVVLAEMGDKTQLLAMAFAARLRWQTVMWGVLAATAANHLIAVMAGNFLTHLIPIEYIKIAAAISFILFGLWTLHKDNLHGEENKYNFSPFWTVTIAFFIAEMGDKTQLTTVALAAKYNTIIPVWIGAISGMMIADAIGIIAGIVLHKNIPEKYIRWIASAIFIVFGLYGLFEALIKYF